MPLIRLALASLANRRASALIVLLVIALSSALLLTVERVRTETRLSFANTVSGTDLLVGARAGSINLLLYAVFRIGHATHNIRWDSYQQIAALPQVKWAIPLSLGDSHRGYPVLGTSADYFTHYRYGERQALQLREGRPFADLYDVVLGAEVARALGYRLGQRLVLAHGTGRISLTRHDDKPFRVSGILAPTGTPVDRTLHISLAGMQALHIDWKQGVPVRGRARLDAEQARQQDLTPQAITAVLLGLEQRVATFAVQRAINDYRGEPLLAVLPGVALQELWSLMASAEQALLLVSACVVLVGLLGMLTALLASLGERRREMAILRSVGARPWQIAALLLAETGALTLAGLLGGLGLLYLTLLAGRGWLLSEYGLHLPLSAPSAHEWQLLGATLLAGLLLGLLPAWRAYRQSLVDGLSIRL
ncbi:ABC transporter permease [Pseudomonas sp. NW5]|uniref:ABC transporter permease n=1 Tax=Pseudomonas sp. NW5 TaxID=2934934 RepID=UPI0020204EEE|nr:ABC transporter permease [Pseudomonas sp. NW5]MCL7462835.1 FtsX-like permease family protein [Pseudomonas sp. NW5]